MTATDLGADRRPERGLRRLLRALERGDAASRSVERPVLCVRSPRRPGPPAFGMFFGAGLVYRAVDWLHRSLPPGRGQGLWGAGVMTTAMVARMMFRQSEGLVAPDKCDVHVNDAPIPDAELYLLMATTLDRLFLGLDPFWGEGDGSVRLTALAARAERLSRAAPGILRGRPRPWLVPERGYHSARCRRARMRIGCGFTIDGELFPPEPDEAIELSTDHRITFLRA